MYVPSLVSVSTYISQVRGHKKGCREEMMMVVVVVVICFSKTGFLYVVLNALELAL